METKIKKPTQKQLAQAFGRSTRTIRRWLKPRSLLKLGRKSKINENILIPFLIYCIRDSDLTQQEMADNLSKNIGQPITQQAVSWILKKNRIARKVATKQFSEQDKKKAKQFTKDNYWLLSLSSLYAVDECGFNLGEVPRYAYARKGQRAIVSRPGKRGENHTLVLCVRNTEKQAVIDYKLIPPNKQPDKKTKKKKGIIRKGTKAGDFHDFLKGIDFPTNQKNYLLLDNAKIHHANEACKKTGRLPIKELAIQKSIQLQYLPPYSPQLNPVELCFNFLRNNTERKRPRTFEELKNSIDKAIETLNQQDLTKYFKKCFNYFEEKKKMNVIENWEKEPLFEVMVGQNQIEQQKYYFKQRQIYPSWRWLKLGARPTAKKLCLSIRKAEDYFAKSLNTKN